MRTCTYTIILLALFITVSGFGRPPELKAKLQAADAAPLKTECAGCIRLVEGAKEQPYPWTPGDDLDDPPRVPVLHTMKIERSWLICYGSGSYGLTQFADRTGEDVPWVRRISIHLGTHRLIVGLRASAVTAVAFLAVSSLVLLASIFARRVSHANAA